MSLEVEEPVPRAQERRIHAAVAARSGDGDATALGGWRLARTPGAAALVAVVLGSVAVLTAHRAPPVPIVASAESLSDAPPGAVASGGAGPRRRGAPGSAS